ncbi:hypothetical protein S58_48530 [Bradyrhizobium oligotrophicum S58]|uniref:Uncharacterized protein n=1 Tax=Bradyrhizobium oligotrophicum S58 TaxID=1245469 RepID=M4ZAY5_9BRAD|nr:hypothetical protein [Bradyrhizobium oligotrophicum]BAM90832.1 hypothetical protein S58_48530 [Bradyrhizobium oligotrophicum S58]
MNDLGFRPADRQQPGRGAASADHAAIDAAWHVLEAANELGDETAVAACRRVIDASLNGAGADRADIQLVTDYFR